MRIGFLTSDLSTNNGWATYSLSLLRALHALGIQTTVITAQNSPLVDFPIHRLLPAVTPPEIHSFLKGMRQLPRARRILRDCDIIHCSAEPYAILGAAVAGNRPLFITAHGSYVNLPRMRAFPMNRLYERAFRRSRLICVSHYTESVARDLLPGIQTRVITHGVDVASFLDPPLLDINKAAPTVIAVGGVKRRKGTLQLVEAMARVRETIPDAQCLIMGPPLYESAYTRLVQRRIDELGLSEHVKIMGFVAEGLKHAWMAAADVLALPAINDGLYFEGFGLTLYEAGAAGTAVIGTDDCGVMDAIDAGVSGIIVSQANIAVELPNAILRLLEDPALAARMGAAGRAKAKSQTWAGVARQVAAGYAEALKRA